MKVSKEQNASNREALIAAASSLFQQQGFAATGVAQISEEAGLTQGGFYGHFKSKSLLVEAACRQSLANGRDSWYALLGSGANDLDTLVDAYVSNEHVEAIAEGCPMAAYSCEIKSQDETVKDTFTHGFEDMVAILQEVLAGSFPNEAARREALFFMCSMVGSVAMARATKFTNSDLAEEIIAATRENLKSLAHSA
ncbi:TetR/AcrR family transcriptional regulator [Pseudomonas vancouverensis]|uniref:TetR/AcrR family transcriptional regulator n=1 Tax=Pseudomonas vancouverensis TaxID=95300 RepID=A0A1H2NXA8_PSEVA|nr:TetR/AcrR family transcriptional regulator [Pseudomonas vancouverensis]KAB0496498.1 TetR/AcrR family transcriptional regulator [Pseudomonas vancouverensis]TDB64794.1 TetR/AcrR family transcriptional regulator [Pseudomonas vancouverensis]SDV10023.1 transcriptional regulator, TetR family [Pseudomonas vancouverensis]